MLIKLFRSIQNEKTLFMNTFLSCTATNSNVYEFFLNNFNRIGVGLPANNVRRHGLESGMRFLLVKVLLLNLYGSSLRGSK